MQHILRGVLSTTTALCGLIAAYPAMANPEGGVVAAGQATIQQSGTKLDIHQSTNKAVIDWRSFDIAPNEHTQFHQPSAASLTLNRVNDVNPSNIAGRLTANGNVIIVNPNGVVFSKTAVVDVGGLVASSADIDDAQFMNSNTLTFDKQGQATARVVNEGTITAKEAGLVGLVAPQVENNGVIQARLGKVALASGDAYTLDLAGDGILNVRVSGDLHEQVVKNTGTIEADGGNILLTAAAAREHINSLIDNSGTLRANAASQKNGVITLYAEGSNAVAGNVQADKGQKTGRSTIISSGIIDTSGQQAGQKGGDIKLVADHIGIAAGAHINASGDAGGGQVLIGGAYQGKGDTPTALRTIMQAGSLIEANAHSSGNGGEVILWADDRTEFLGDITVNALGASGDGGFVETSGKQTLLATGNVLATSLSGKRGQWLLDPNDITINTAADDNISSSGVNPITFDTTDDSAVVTVASILTSLNNGVDVIIQTGTANTNMQSGNITVASAINKTMGGEATLTLKAIGSIIVNAAISSISDKLNVILNADSGGNSSGYINITDDITSNGGNITMGGGADPSATAAWGNAGQAYGIYINNATVDAGAGNIIARGHGFNSAGTDSNYGVYVFNSSGKLKTTSGSITVNGVGGDGRNKNHGVFVGTGGQITTESGIVQVTGTAGADDTTSSNTDNYGVRVGGLNSSINSTNSGMGLGSVTVTGTGADAYSRNYGIFVDAKGTIVTDDANLFVSGQGGHGVNSTNYGVYVTAADSFIRSTGGGNVQVLGTGGNGTVNNYGIYMNGSGVIEANTGQLTVTGTAGVGTGGNGYGIYVTGASSAIRSIGQGMGVGVATITGNGKGAASNNAGILISQGTISTDDAAMTVTGEGEDAANQNFGIRLTSSGSIKGLGDGDLSVVGMGGNSGYGATGILISGSSTISSVDGDLSLRGIKGTGSSSFGIQTSTGTNVIGGNLATGDITLSANDLGFVANTSIETTGNITVNPYATNTIGVGTGAGTLSLTDVTLGYFDWGASSTLTIGGSADSGNIDINTGFAFSKRVAFVTNASSDLTLNSTLSSTATGDAIILSAGDQFINNEGAAALTTSNGRWLIYSANPANDTAGGLSNDFRRFSCTHGGACPAIPGAGNGFLYSMTPVLTITPLQSITYGAADPTATGYSYTTTGYLGADAAADSVTGTILGTSSYNVGSNVGNYNMDYASGSLASALGYGFNYVNAAAGLTVNQAALTITANALSKTYGAADPTLTYGHSGLVAGDGVGVFTGALARAAGETVAGGPYAIGQGTLSAGGNYAITYNAANFTINAAPLTITANNENITAGDALPSFSANYSGFVNSENSSVISGLDFSTPATTSSPAGSYAINPFGATAANYTISFVAGALEIAAAPALTSPTISSFQSYVSTLTSQSGGNNAESQLKQVNTNIAVSPSTGSYSPSGLYNPYPLYNTLNLDGLLNGGGTDPYQPNENI